MRPTLLSLPILAGLTITGLHCAYADPRPPCPYGGQPAVDRCTPVPAYGPRLEVVDESMQKLPTFVHGGTYVLGETGARYLLRVVNPTPTRVEAVVSVDGLDALDGRPASFGKRGYIVPAYGEVTLDGWRTSLSSVAAFRFSSVAESYAARTDPPRNVGVIGVAFFRERPPPPVVWRPPPAPVARPSYEGSRGRAGDAMGLGGAGGATTSANKSANAAPSAAAAERPGLGTQFGETQESHVSEVMFVRAGSTPMAVMELRYDDRDGLLSRGIPIPPPPSPRDPENAMRDNAQAFPRFAQPPP